MRIDIKTVYENKRRPLVLDGALGTLLIERGVNPRGALWTTLATFEHSQLVKNIHKEYINAGAEIITANTFNSNPASLKLAGYSEKTSEEIVKAAVQLAKEAREETVKPDTIIAGCNAPAEDCYQKERTLSRAELEENHRRHIDLLWEAGADIIWNETHGHFDEIEIICAYCEENNLPYAVNLYFETDFKLLSGEPLHETVERIIKNFPNAIIGFNCIPPSNFTDFISRNSVKTLWGFYMNCGPEDKTSDEFFCAISPDVYIEYVDKIINENTLYAGSCCGSNPGHTRKIKEYLVERFEN